MKPNHHDALIDEIGGTGVVAALIGISDSAVAQWRKDGIPTSRLYQIRIKLEQGGKPVPKRLMELTA